MPDILFVLSRKWKLIITIAIIATLIALVVALLSPKKYLAVSTALPANSMLSDKARIFNKNIEALYSEVGTADELDKVQGTAQLDTVFIAAAMEMNLVDHYATKPGDNRIYKAAKTLKVNSEITRSAYGELKVKVWDMDRTMAARLSNFIMQKLQQMHQDLSNEANQAVLKQLKEKYTTKQKEFISLNENDHSVGDSLSAQGRLAQTKIHEARMAALTEQMQEYEKNIDEYELAINTKTPVLLIVENARPPLKADKPDVLSITLLSFFAALVFSFLLALLLESRKRIA